MGERQNVRVVESVPRNYGQAATIISLLSLSGVEATMLLEGALDTTTFKAYCEQLLCESVKLGENIERK